MNFAKPLLGIISALCLQLPAQAQSLNAIQAELNKQDFRAASLATARLMADLGQKLPAATSSRILEEVGAQVRPPATIPAYAATLALLESHLRENDTENAYRQSIILQAALMRLSIASQPDARAALLEARSRAAAQPSFANYSALAGAAISAKEYQEARSAAEKALSLRTPDDPLLSTSYAALHVLYNNLAYAHYRLGEKAKMREALLQSLDSGNLPMIFRSPRLQLAREILRGPQDEQLRSVVVEYLEKAKAYFPEMATELAAWAQQIRSGATPDLMPPARLFTQ
jgi:tetratricopeptide (TPR) repeat protein